MGVGGKHGGRDRYVEIGVPGGEGMRRSVWTGSAVIYTGDELCAFRILMQKSPFLRESSVSAWPYVEMMVGHDSPSNNRLALQFHHTRSITRSERPNSRKRLVCTVIPAWKLARWDPQRRECPASHDTYRTK